MFWSWLAAAVLALLVALLTGRSGALLIGTGAALAALAAHSAQPAWVGWLAAAAGPIAIVARAWARRR